MITREEAESFCDARRTAQLKLTNNVEFGDLDRQAPDIAFYPDGDCYYSPDEEIIHIGMYAPIEIFAVEDEASYVGAIDFVRQHEEQHVRSSASRPYLVAMTEGRKAVMSYIRKEVDGDGRPFVNDAEMSSFAGSLPGKGVYISWREVDQTVQFLANALEDGRIERLRAERFPGFAAQRRDFRLRQWYVSGGRRGTWPEYASMDAAQKLSALLNGILSLATCQLYPKGFFGAYAGTPLMEELDALKPAIARAVMSGRTRGLIDPMKELCAALAPLILEASRMPAWLAALEQLLQELSAELVGGVLDGQIKLDESAEDTDAGGASAVGGDLAIEVDDETFEKLKEKAAGKGGGLMVKKKEAAPAENGDAASGDTADEGTGADDASADGDGPGGENTAPGGSSDIAAPAENGGGRIEAMEDGPMRQPTGECKAANGNGGKSAGEPTGKDEDTSAAPLGEGEDASSDGGLHDEEVMRRMEEAAARTADLYDEMAARTVNAGLKASAAAGGREVKDTDPPINPESVEDICGRFIELKRAYGLDDALPPVLAQRGKTLRRKNEEYFRSLTSPNRRYQDQGSVDPSRIYGLAIGETDIFMKEGKKKGFDGCAYILLDNSGSMRGAKRQEACKAAAVIEEGFKGLMPFKIVAFDDNEHITHEVIKGWSESHQRRNCCYNFLLHGRSGYGNDDGYDIAIAARELSKRPERKKLLLVLSDGAPASTGRCKGAIEQARAAGIRVTGIYFGGGGDPRTFARMYEKDYICCEVSEIDRELQKAMLAFSRS